MGRGDKKTAKGKRFQGSFGKSRPAKTTKSKKPVAAATEVKASQFQNFKIHPLRFFLSGNLSNRQY
jgi:30S ribosomal protein S31